MKLALCPLSRNVVSANAASPSGAGSAGIHRGASVRSGASVRTAMWNPPSGAGARPAGVNARMLSAVPIPQRREVVRIVREVLGAGRRDEDIVLEADTAVPLPVEARLDRDAVAGDELLVAELADTRRLVDLEADAVAEAMEEAVGER